MSAWLNLQHEVPYPKHSSILERHQTVQHISFPRHKREPGEPRGARSHQSERSITVHLGGTSADYMISHQLGLIPQATGKLIHERYWGAVTM
eukprot:7679637-Ditylum_brightwellii.AAC.1